MDYKKLHKHIAKRYDIYLFEDEIQEIVDIVLEMHNKKPETCTMKTAMQELIDDLRGFRDEHTSPLVISRMNKVLLKASLLLTKEKEQIVNAFKEGCFNGSFFDEKWDDERAREYYNETYGGQ